MSIHDKSAAVQAVQHIRCAQAAHKNQRDTQEQDDRTHKRLLHHTDRAVDRRPQDEPAHVAEGEACECGARSVRDQDRVRAAPDRLRAHHRVPGLLRPRLDTNSNE